jgi:asparagine synthase (glutamine-hydrolysing)
MFRNIRKVPPAHVLTFQDGHVRLHRYWDINFTDKLALSEEGYIDLLEENLKGAVESHLVSDVPVGAFLSGGMDTSMIVAVMGKLMSSRFKTFSVGVKEQDFNELPYARMVARQYQTDYIEKVVNADIITLLTRIIWHMDEPSDPIAACMFHAANLASDHVKVVMGGDGGDELFAGFDRYAGVGYISYLNLIPSLMREKVIGPLVDLIPDSFTYKSFQQKMRWAHQLSFFEEGERYAEATAFFRFSHKDKSRLFHEDVWDKLGHNKSSDVIVETDRMNMAHSLEARSPFLDHTLVEVLATFPGSLKIRNRTLKYILRKLAERYLQNDIIKRKKQGFMFPVAYWFRNELYGFIEAMLINSQFVKNGIFRKETVQSLLEAHRSNKVDNHVRIWMLLNLEVWYQLYIEQRKTDDVQYIISNVHEECVTGNAKDH